MEFLTFDHVQEEDADDKIDNTRAVKDPYKDKSRLFKFMEQKLNKEKAFREIDILKAQYQYLSVKTTDLNSILDLNQIQIKGQDRVLFKLLGEDSNYMDEAYSAPGGIDDEPNCDPSASQDFEA
ncbi:hypothetical protein DFH28DRAFT_922258 [Melampsora americana]|nr:hypothetical protein DFH28DRAFT_922258 [Melampsora americana]